MDPATAELVKLMAPIGGYGLLGSLFILLLWAYFKKDKQLTDSNDAWSTKLMGIQREVINSVNSMNELMEAYEKRESSIDRLVELTHKFEGLIQRYEEREREQQSRRTR